MKRLMKGILTDERGGAAAKILIVLAVFIAIVVIGGVVAGAVLLANPVEITVTNHTGSTAEIAKESAAQKFNFLPNIEIPSQIAPGETAVIQVPERFLTQTSVASGGVKIRAFGQAVTLGTSGIDMQRSTWDNQPLAGLIGKEIDVSGKHTLVVEGR